MTLALEATDVVAGYGEAEILHGVSIAVEEGEMVAIIGPNGAGKSTLLKTIFGLIPTRAGSVRLGTNDITSDRPDSIVKAGMSYVPQVENVFPSLSINENLEMGAYVRQDGLRERLEVVYDMFPDLTSRRGDGAGKLSGGQRQMLALARALMLDPQVLLLDEPSAGLSPKMVDSIFSKIVDINLAGTAVLLIEQNAREALSFSHRAYVLVTGENRMEGDAKTMIDNEEVGRLYLGE
ncbi:MAG: ABC transporter ATP-binding protein [Chloroflexi bacterium]|nr:ABC transporter ATP-binding protein [Chloroflexota bacterium]